MIKTVVVLSICNLCGVFKDFHSPLVNSEIGFSELTVNTFDVSGNWKATIDWENDLSEKSDTVKSGIGK